MAEVLAVQGMSLQAMNRANKVLKSSLVNADPQVQLTIANSLWAKQNYSFKSDFLQRNRQFYEAEIAALDFSRPDATKTINRWVAENTNGKIEQIIEGIQPNQILFLINAIYFKGNWTQAFEPSQTTEQPFYLADGTSKPHPLMSQSGEYQYYETDTFEAISLPYGEGRFSFYVFLPREASNLNAFQQQLTTENWQKWMQQFQSRQGTIVLPRFQLEYAIQLNDALKALGMGVAFESRANFSEMVDGGAYIDAVQHKTFVEVNETGTEAAAATSVAIAESARIGDEPFQMVVNRPFWCAIRDNQTGAILFMGSIAEPQ
jgi:serpin B